MKKHPKRKRRADPNADVPFPLGEGWAFARDIPGRGWARLCANDGKPIVITSKATAGRIWRHFKRRGVTDIRMEGLGRVWVKRARQAGWHVVVTYEEYAQHMSIKDGEAAPADLISEDIRIYPRDPELSVESIQATIARVHPNVPWYLPESHNRYCFLPEEKAIQWAYGSDENHFKTVCKLVEQMGWTCVDYRKQAAEERHSLGPTAYWGFLTDENGQIMPMVDRTFARLRIVAFKDHDLLLRCEQWYATVAPDESWDIYGVPDLSPLKSFRASDFQDMMLIVESLEEFQDIVRYNQARISLDKEAEE